MSRTYQIVISEDQRRLLLAALVTAPGHVAKNEECDLLAACLAALPADPPAVLNDFTL